MAASYPIIPIPHDALLFWSRMVRLLVDVGVDVDQSEVSLRKLEETD
jgi:hypothetical protein